MSHANDHQPSCAMAGGFSVFPRGYINKMGRAVLSV